MGQSSPESLEVMRAIAALRAADSLPSQSTSESCSKQRDQRPARPLTAYCQSVLKGRLPRDTTTWFVPREDDSAADFARISKHPLVVRPDLRVTCPSTQRPRGPGIGYLASATLRWIRADSVRAFIRWDCAEPKENRAFTPHSRYHLIEEYHVARRSGRWVAVAGMITVT